jgi:hypothetical protein
LNKQRIDGATASSYTVRTTGAYYVTGVNSLGEGAKNANAHMVFIDVCADGFDYTTLLGNYNAGGVPSFYQFHTDPETGKPYLPGPSTWTAQIKSVTPESSTFAYEYEISSFADWNEAPFRLSALPNTDEGMIAFVVNQRRALTSITEGGTTYNAYFELTFTANGSTYYFFGSADYVQAFWDIPTSTLDFSGIYTYEGKDYELLAGIMGRRANDNVWGGSFSELYKDCKYVRSGPLGAGAFTGVKVAGAPRLRQTSPVAAPLKAVYIDFDPTKFKRK